MKRTASALAVLLVAGCSLNLGLRPPPGPLEKEVVLGEDGPEIAMLEIRGVISQEPEASTLGPDGPSMVARTREVLERAAEDDVAALVLSIQSPGGTVSASETIHHEILRWKRETGKPVVAYFDGLGTSGAYYIAMAADRVVAHPTAITGSIGVIMVGLNLAGLMEKLGVENQTLVSGPFKDAGSPLRAMRDDERAQMQAVVDDLFGRFREVVADGRPDLEPATIAALADGRIYTARQAAEAGLIDGIGYLEDVVASAEKLAGIGEESQLVIYRRAGSYRQNFYARAPLQVDVDLLGAWRPLAPGFYYLWPVMIAGQK